MVLIIAVAILLLGLFITILYGTFVYQKQDAETVEKDGFIVTTYPNGSVTLQIQDNISGITYLDRISLPPKEATPTQIASLRNGMQAAHQLWATNHQERLAKHEGIRVRELELLDKISTQERLANSEIYRLQDEAQIALTKVDSAKANSKKKIEEIEASTREQEGLIRKELHELEEQKKQLEENITGLKSQITESEKETETLQSKKSSLQQTFNYLVGIVEKIEKGTSVPRQRWILLAEETTLRVGWLRKNFPKIRVNPVLAGVWVFDSKEDTETPLLKEISSRSEEFRREALGNSNQRYLLLELSKYTPLNRSGYLDGENWPSINIWQEPF